MKTTMKALAFLAGSVLALAVVISVVHGPMPSLLAAASSSQSASGNSSFIAKSDVPFSPRFSPGSYPALHPPQNWKGAWNGFGANLILWAYSGPSFASSLPAGTRIQCALPTRIASSTALDQRCTDRQGNSIGLFGSTVPAADVNSPSWRNFMLASAEAKFDAGCRMFEQDEPHMNYYEAKYLQGSASGCFDDASMTGFNAYLKAHYSSKLAGWGITNIDTFNYRTQDIAALKPYFLEYQKQSVIDFHSWLHDQVRAYAAAKGAKVSFGSNIGYGLFDDSDWLAKDFDYAVAEFYGAGSPLAQLRDTASWYRTHYTHTSAITVPYTDVTLNKRIIASAYPLGLPVIAPWDVYIAPSPAPRFFGNIADFGPLYKMVSSNKGVFESYSFLADSGSANGSISSLPPGPPPPPPPPDGTVTKVVASTSPARVIVSWDHQSDTAHKAIPKSSLVKIKNTLYATVVATGVGYIYLPAHSSVSVGDPIRFVPAPALNGADGYVTNVDTTTYPGRVTLYWSDQANPSFKTIPKGTHVSVAGTTYSTVSATGVGSLYLPAGAHASVGDLVKISTGSTGSGNGSGGNGSGSVESIPNTNASNKDEQSLNSASAPEFLFSSASLSSSAAYISGGGSYFLVVTQNDADHGKRAVHVINWGTDASAKTLYLKANAFTTPPAHLVTPSHPAGVAIIAQATGGYFIYQLGPVDTWAFVY